MNWLSDRLWLLEAICWGLLAVAFVLVALVLTPSMSAEALLFADHHRGYRFLIVGVSFLGGFLTRFALKLREWQRGDKGQRPPGEDA